MTDVLTLDYGPGVSTGKRAQVAVKLMEASDNIRSNRIDKLSNEDLRLMFEAYDELFFDHWFRQNFRGTLKFTLSRRMTKSAGLTLCPKNIAKLRQEELTLEIRIGIDLIYRFGASGGTRTVCGISTKSSLEALQLVFEHELCHVLEFILFHKSSCKGKRFQALSFRLFGHTERVHALPVINHRAAIPKSLKKRIGDPVKFRFKNMELTGTVYSINKRAAVMVRDRKGNYSDKLGNRYTKYYIPLQLLQ